MSDKLRELVANSDPSLPKFLRWLGDRLVHEHCENPNADFVQACYRRAAELEAAALAEKPAPQRVGEGPVDDTVSFSEEQVREKLHNRIAARFATREPYSGAWSEPARVAAEAYLEIASESESERALGGGKHEREKK
jgi:hypothetical protein